MDFSSENEIPGSAIQARWEVWYQDTFDRETPRSIESSGLGLVSGLITLWKLHLTETVQPQGTEGFSRFNLWWIDEAKSVRVTGDSQGARRLRDWLLGREVGRDDVSRPASKAPEHRGTGGAPEQVSGTSETRLLKKIAVTHARLLLTGRNSEPILSLAMEVRSQTEFQERLSSLYT